MRYLGNYSLISRFFGDLSIFLNLGGNAGAYDYNIFSGLLKTGLSVESALFSSGVDLGLCYFLTIVNAALFALGVVAIIIVALRCCVRGVLPESAVYMHDERALCAAVTDRDASDIRAVARR